jgi:hypothetical protein
MIRQRPLSRAELDALVAAYRGPIHRGNVVTRHCPKCHLVWRSSVISACERCGHDRPIIRMKRGLIASGDLLNEAGAPRQKERPQNCG